MKGILFTEILFNKTIRKEKTMTRRAPASLKVINESPDDWALVRNVFTWGGFETPEKSGVTEFGFSQKGGGLMTYIREPEVVIKPTYKVGDVVYIKEPVAEYHYKGLIDSMRVNLHKPAYKYGMAEHQAVTYDGSTPRIIPRDGLKFQNKMFVGADKARYYIRITNVKCERLYDISDEDCVKEGVKEIEDLLENTCYPNYNSHAWNKSSKENNELLLLDTPQESFFSLFRFANKVSKSKEIPNLWVLCYEYVLCDINGNKL